MTPPSAKPKSELLGSPAAASLNDVDEDLETNVDDEEDAAVFKDDNDESSVAITIMPAAAAAVADTTPPVFPTAIAMSLPTFGSWKSRALPKFIDAKEKEG